MPLTDKALDRASEYRGLPEERKDTIVRHLRSLGPEARERSAAGLVAAGGEEARFIQWLHRGASPQDKKMRETTNTKTHERTRKAGGSGEDV